MICARSMGLCGMLPALLYVLSVTAHAWLLVEVDPSRSTCAAIANESIAVLVLNVLLLLLGGCRGCLSRRDSFFGCPNFFGLLGLAALAAGVVAVGSRLTLFTYEAHRICADDVASVAADDMLRDATRRERAGMAAWFGVLLLGVALLLQHCSVGCEDEEDCEGQDRKERRPRHKYAMVAHWLHL